MIINCPHCGIQQNIEYEKRAEYECDCEKHFTICPSCEQAITTTASKCKHCGTVLKNDKTQAQYPQSKSVQDGRQIIVYCSLVGLPIAAAILLFVALLPGLPIGYFQFLRIAVCAAAAYVCYVSYKEKSYFWMYFFIPVAILFNPLAPIFLEKDSWQVIDVITGVLFLASVFLFIKPFFAFKKEEIKNIWSKIIHGAYSPIFLCFNFTGKIGRIQWLVGCLYMFPIIVVLSCICKSLAEEKIATISEVIFLFGLVTQLLKTCIDIKRARDIGWDGFSAVLINTGIFIAYSIPLLYFLCAPIGVLYSCILLFRAGKEYKNSGENLDIDQTQCEIKCVKAGCVEKKNILFLFLIITGFIIVGFVLFVLLVSRLNSNPTYSAITTPCIDNSIDYSYSPPHNTQQRCDRSENPWIFKPGIDNSAPKTSNWVELADELYRRGKH